MREAIHQILTEVSDSFSTMIDMALANEIRVGGHAAGTPLGLTPGWGEVQLQAQVQAQPTNAALCCRNGHLNTDL